MSETLRTSEHPSQLNSVADEGPITPDTERAALLASLEKAAADIASGDFDILTPQLLRPEFDASR